MPKPGPSWLGNPYLAMFSIIMINTWRGLPFYGITLLAGLQTVPPELYEAATIDGASGWQRFRYVTLPLLKPIILIVTLFSVIFTFADFQLVYVLTHGGPQNATQLFATYAFDIGMGAGQLGLGASVALTMLPALGLLIIALTLYMRRHDGRTGWSPAMGGSSGCVRVWLPVGFFLVVALFPFYWMAITSIKPNAELYNKNLMPLLVRNPTLKHYVDLLTETSFLLWTWNTMLVAVVSTAISLVLGTMLAYPLARMRFAGAGLIAMTVAAIYLVPQPLLFLPLADVINRLELGNTLTSVILTYPTMLVPFCAWLLLGYFKTVPKELEEAARIDGASRLQTMRQIFLPLCTPGFISAGIFAFTLSQNEFLYALIFLTKSAVRTVPVGVIAELIRGDVFYWGQLMAGALLGSIPVALIYSFFVEHYVAGLTSGSVKG